MWLQIPFSFIFFASVQRPISRTRFTISYLINSCGLSPQSALSASKQITIKTTKKPYSILALLKSQGFIDTQIVRLSSNTPDCFYPNGTSPSSPNLIFASVGYSGTALTALIASYPDILKASLNKKLKRYFDSVSSILESDQQIAAALRRSFSRLLTDKVERSFLPNVRTLQSYGVPAPNIARLIPQHPRALMHTRARFNMKVELIRKRELIDPLSSKFLKGMRALGGMKPSTWEKKVAFFKSLGWPEAEFISAFTKQPLFMMRSDEKIGQAMDFFADVMRWGPLFLAARPVILALSFEKWIVSRCSVLRVLASKGLVTKNSNVQFLIKNEIDFLSKYVAKYQDEVPEVLCAYKCNLDFVGFRGESVIIDGSYSIVTKIAAASWFRLVLVDFV